MLRGAFRTLVRGAAVLSRPTPLGPFTAQVISAFGGLIAKSRGVRPVTEVAELGPMWHRAFPSSKPLPIVGGDERTVRAEIHISCPLRGTGDVAACHRMMAYDRAILNRAGGQFVVLRSQAEPGRDVCEVAMRRIGEPTNDLVPAHLRPKR